MDSENKTLTEEEITKKKQSGRNFIGLDGIDEIDIEGQEGWEEGIVVKNCPDLTELNFSSCDIKKIIIQNCPKLKVINGHNNQLKELNLFNFPELEEVNIPFNNKMRDLKISKCSQIHTIFCFNNNLSYLPKLQQFENLKKLHCYKNNNLSSVICKGLKHLEEVNVQECNIGIVNFEDCESLRILDLAENQIREININDCKNLEQLSCRDNLLKDIDLTNNIKLISLILYNNWFAPMDISKFSHLVNIKSLAIGLYFAGDAKEEVVKKTLTRIWIFGGKNIWYGSLESFKWMSNLERLIINATNIDKGQEHLPSNLAFLDCKDFKKEFNLLKLLNKNASNHHFEPRKVKVIHDWWEEQKKKNNHFWKFFRWSSWAWN
jgi:hypothetical protein